MKHAREDYNRIQDPAGLIPEDEPVFLLRGQDKFAAAAVRAYAMMLENELLLLGSKVCPHCADATRAMIARCHVHAAAMDAWPKKKFPDVTPLIQPCEGNANV